VRFFGFHRESRLLVAVPEFSESEAVFDVTAIEDSLNSSDVSIKPIFVGLGEVLWDVFPDGRRPGGAPANFAWHANQLGARGLVVSRVGDARVGAELVGVLSGRGLDSDHVQRDSEQSTGTVSITTTADGQPDYTIHEPVAWDCLEWTDALASLFPTVSGVCFGTIAQRRPTSRATIMACLSAMPEASLKVYDVNLRKTSWDLATVESSLELADIVKLNDEELTVLSGRLGWPGSDLSETTEFLQDRYGLDGVWVTRGAGGCLLRGVDELVECAGIEVEVADTVGAGDSFTAAMIWSLWLGCSLSESAELANRVGALVASRQGGMPDLSDCLPGLIASGPWCAS
jgi:fructokinase